MRLRAVIEQTRPVSEGAHVAEELRGMTAEVRQEARLHRVETAGDPFRGLLRARQRTRDDERVAWRVLCELLAHRASGGRERARVVLQILALCVSADVEDRHAASVPWSRRDAR